MPAVCWRITRHNTLAALADLYPQWLRIGLVALTRAAAAPHLVRGAAAFSLIWSRRSGD
ncbi:hypothetical protein [Bradyrhizobium australafricanum]|uniref:hypothetical protein n=1 Tax=Bradyrhizobium australafricanum TaxID=2821406 RepID=UPI001CE296B2|nr:hypothetical protein [Bradyrhizobium australafricanum]MCA6097108.1 hypothetical protein [Bradyrhizobium australafricanum]